MEYSFNIYLAEETDVNQAVFLKNIHFWIEKNKANKSNFYDGKYWTYNSVSSYSDIFIFWTDKQMRTIIDKVTKSELVEIGNYNKTPYDKTKWYTLTNKFYQLYAKCLEKEAESLCPNGRIDNPEKAIGEDENGESNESKSKTYTILKPSLKPVNKPDETNLLSLPECLNTEQFHDTWKLWVEYKKQSKKKLTKSTISFQIKRLSKHPLDAVQMIENSISNGWSGLFEVKKSDKQSSGIRDEVNEDIMQGKI